MAEILKGAPVAKALCAKAAERVNRLREMGVVPTLAIVRVGENDADMFYERSAVKRMASVGIGVQRFPLSEDVSEEELVEVIERLNRDRGVHGVLLFKPLPMYMDSHRVCESLDVTKDVDGITEGSLAGLFIGSGRGFCPCTAEACLNILDHYNVPLSGKKVCVIGRSLVVGKPVSQLLISRNATVTVCHTKTLDLGEEIRRSDIVITTAGKAGIVSAKDAVPGQVIIDVGTNTGADGKICGDADFYSVEPIVSAITPVPGGVGAVTTSVLAGHVALAAERQVIGEVD